MQGDYEHFLFEIPDILYPYGFFMLCRIKGGNDKILRYHFKELKFHV